MDLIDRHRAIECMFEEMPGLTFYGVLRVLRNLPTVDACVPLLCKDCVYYQPNSWCIFHSREMRAIDFCSRGVNIK